MQFVRSQDLKPGMRLAKPIYNKMGVLLYERNTKLTLQSINSIDNFGLSLLLLFWNRRSLFLLFPKKTLNLSSSRLSICSN